MKLTNNDVFLQVLNKFNKQKQTETPPRRSKREVHPTPKYTPSPLRIIKKQHQPSPLVRAKRPDSGKKKKLNNKDDQSSPSLNRPRRPSPEPQVRLQILKDPRLTNRQMRPENVKNRSVLQETANTANFRPLNRNLEVDYQNTASQGYPEFSRGVAASLVNGAPTAKSTKLIDIVRRKESMKRFPSQMALPTVQENCRRDAGGFLIPNAPQPHDQMVEAEQRKLIDCLSEFIHCGLFTPVEIIFHIKNVQTTVMQKMMKTIQQNHSEAMLCNEYMSENKEKSAMVRSWLQSTSGEQQFANYDDNLAPSDSASNIDPGPVRMADMSRMSRRGEHHLYAPRPYYPSTSRFR